MLVGAFQIQVRDPVRRPILAVAQHEGMGRAAIEPHVQHVEDLFIIGRIHDAIQHLFLESLHIPDIRAFRLERRLDARVDLGVAQKEVRRIRPRALLHESGQRHAPGALARQHPIRPRLDHRMQPVAPGRRRPFHQLVDRVQRPRADRVAIGRHPVVQRLVDGDKPLRRVAVDHRGLRPPGMRVGMLQLRLGKQRAGIGQLLDDRHVRRPFLAVGQDDVLPAEQAAGRRDRSRPPRRCRSSAGRTSRPADSRHRRGEGAVWTNPVPASSVT